MVEVDLHSSTPMISGKCEISFNHFKVNGIIVNEGVIFYYTESFHPERIQEKALPPACHTHEASG